MATVELRESIHSAEEHEKALMEQLKLVNETLLSKFPSSLLASSSFAFFANFLPVIRI